MFRFSNKNKTDTVFFGMNQNTFGYTGIHTFYLRIDNTRADILESVIFISFT